jgi:hypothetical protein
MPAAQWLRTLITLTIALAPAIVRAQDPTPADPPKLRLLNDTPSLWTVPPQSTDLWKPPPLGSSWPEWRVDWKAVTKGPLGLELSAGVIGQSGPMPAYFVPGLATGSLLRGPGAERQQWDLKFGVKTPPLTIKGATLNGFGELFIPVTPRNSGDVTSPLLNSRALRVGVTTIF